MTKEQEVQMNNYYLELLKKGSINTLNEAMIFKLSYEKAFSLNSVSQQRKQLEDYQHFIDWNEEHDRKASTSERIESFIASNCG